MKDNLANVIKNYKENFKTRLANSCELGIYGDLLSCLEYKIIDMPSD